MNKKILSKKLIEFILFFLWSWFKINYHSLNRASVHKADNLNHFLKHSGATFDYLLISDSDVAIDSNFVTTSLKFFYSKNQKRLGWVSSYLEEYETDNLYTNTLRNMENVSLIEQYCKNFERSLLTNLYSAACLIKKETLEELNMKFPNSCLEDAWMELFSTSNYWAGLINPFSISLQSFDLNVENTFRRYFRIDDWSVKYFKEYFFVKQNESKSPAYVGIFAWNVISNFLIWIKLLIVSIFIFVLANYWHIVINNYLYWLFLSLFLFSFITKKMLKWFLEIKVVGFRKIFIFYFLSNLFGIPHKIYSSFNFFKAFFGSKYATFIPTRSNSKNPNNFFNKNKKYILIFIATSILLITVNLSFSLTKTFNKNLYLSFIFISLNIIIGWVWFATLCFWILYSLSLIKCNSTYNPNDFVYSTISKKLRHSYLEKHNKKFNNFK